jgi:hypothetical protein
MNSFHFSFSSNAPFVGGKPDSFRIAEVDVLPFLKAHYGLI